MKKAHAADDFKEAAKRRHAVPGNIEVARFSNVQHVDGGAFVEMVAWVQDSDVDGLLQEREFNQKKSA